MSGIVCAVRGGPDSHPTIARAIALARDTGLSLYFLYIVNLDFLERTSSSRIRTISQEMRQMGEFILLTAQAQAAEQEIDAQGVVREGNVTGEIAGFCHEVGADYLVVGQPRIQSEDSIFDEAMLAAFVQHIEAQTGAKVVLAARGSHE
jgi:nucleotide-binding universal stress UspA family protein